MYCRKCGSLLPDESFFCPYCGEKVETAATVGAAETPAAATVGAAETPAAATVGAAEAPAAATVGAAETPAAASYPAPGTPAAAPYAAPGAPAAAPYFVPGAPATAPYFVPGAPAAAPYSAPGKKRREKWPFVAVGVGLAVIACVVLLVLYFAGDFSSSSDGTVYNPDIEADLINDGDVTFDSSHLYFVGVFNDTDNYVGVYSTDLNGENKTSLSTNGDILRIRAAGDKIYYDACDDSGIYSIGCFNKNGTEDKTIIRFSYGEKLWYFTVVGDSLYYELDNELHCCDLNGDNDETLLRDIYGVCVVGNDVYYIDMNSVDVFHVKDRTTDELCTTDAYTLLYDDGVVYFTTSDGLYSVPASGGNATCLVQSEYVSLYLAVKGSYVLFVETNQTIESLIYDDNAGDPYGSLCAVNKDGGTVTKCSGQTLCTMFVTPGQTYYLASFTDYTGKVLPLEDMTMPGSD